MVTQLRVVNDCLAIMGEAPLASLSEEHTYRAAIVNKLTDESARIQAKGWWYNTESITLTPDIVDKRIRLPFDVGGTVTFDRRPDLAQRGLLIYDLENGTNEFSSDTVLKARLIRVLPIEDVPISAAEYIAAVVLLWFQNQYDGDQTKTRNLQVALTSLEADMKSEHIRNRAVNLFDVNARLARVRNVVRQLNR